MAILETKLTLEINKARGVPEGVTAFAVYIINFSDSGLQFILIHFSTFLCIHL